MTESCQPEPVEGGFRLWFHHSPAQRIYLLFLYTRQLPCFFLSFSLLRFHCADWRNGSAVEHK
jgi:hypothetical protein